MATIKTNTQRLQEVEREHGMHKDGNPALYVGTYHKYNCGSLFGCWLDLTTFDDYNDFVATCRYLHEDEHDPELMFQDFQYFPEAYYREGWMDEKTFDAIREYADMDEDEQDAYRVFADYTDEPTVEKFHDRYVGKYGSLKECVEQDGDLVASFLGVDYDTLERIASYIDCEAIARELDIDGWLEEGGYVFRSAA